MAARFQSALPLRGAMILDFSGGYSSSNFNPRSPCGERRSTGTGRCGPADFNPRSPCGERRPSATGVCASSLFQSALPLRGATPDGAPHTDAAGISIRAPLAGSDINSDELQTYNYIFQSALPLRGATSHPCTSTARRSNFNPRSPCGERLPFRRIASRGINFNPRSPCGERPTDEVTKPRNIDISIRAPLAGSDRID